VTTVPSQLSFDLQPETLSKLADKLQQKLLSTNASVDQQKNEQQISAKVNDVRELLYEEELTELLELGKQMNKDADYLDEIEDDCFTQSALNIINDQVRAYRNVFLAYRHGKMVGFLLASCAPSMYNYRSEASMQLLYVLPEHRPSTAPFRLVNAYERWATLQGAKFIFTGTVNPKLAAKTSKFFEKLGYPRMGSLHVKVL
jgi:GNAT superfamily N-acetyltransferase